MIPDPKAIIYERVRLGVYRAYWDGLKLTVYRPRRQWFARAGFFNLLPHPFPLRRQAAAFGFAALTERQAHGHKRR